MATVAQRSPARFVVFLLIMAGVFAYIAWKWQDFQRQTAVGESDLPVVVVGGGTSEEAGEPTEAVTGPASGEGAQGPEAGRLPIEEPGMDFAAGRLDRDQARGQRLEMLRSLIDNPNVSAESRAQAEQELLVLSRRIAQESEIEQLLRARGFADALVYLYEQSATVVVRAETLSQSDIAQIADAISKVADIPFEGISVLAKPE